MLQSEVNEVCILYDRYLLLVLTVQSVTNERNNNYP
jgi:hypothetical protein